MKKLERSISFLIFSILFGLILYFQYSTPPITAIPSKSMVPVFHVGDLVVIEKVRPMDVKIGDIIVVDVPKAVRKHFGYPPNLIHRVVQIKHVDGNLQFRVKGDNNNGQDPFTVLPQDIMGKAGRSFRYLGFPILFLNSKQGVIFIIASLMIYCLFIIYDELNKRNMSLRKGLSSLFFSEVVHRTEKIEQSQETIIEMLKNRGSDLNPELAITFESPDSFAALKRQMVENRLLVEKLNKEKGSNPQSEEILHLLNLLEVKISEVVDSVDASDSFKFEKASAEITPEGLPPRKATRKKKRFF
ncbi:MAG TPA: signal peptidase I [Bacillales bacterium]|nr:signal peptidase I [Bacillales bacterium]